MALSRRDLEVVTANTHDDWVADGVGPVAFRLSNDAPSGLTTYFLLDLE